jgi:hypothetical protein
MVLAILSASRALQAVMLPEMRCEGQGTLMILVKISPWAGRIWAQKLGNFSKELNGSRHHQQTPKSFVFDYC